METPGQERADLNPAGAMTLGGMLAAQAKTRPNAVALVDTRGAQSRRLTFVELEREAAAAAEWLQDQGLRKGSRVLVFVPMSTDLYIALLAMFRMGAVAVFLDPSAGRGHIEKCCARQAPDALLAIPKAHLLRFVSAALRRIPLQWVLKGWMPGTVRWLQGADRNHWPPDSIGAPIVITEQDPALITFTSGSTGEPKGAVRTHGFLMAQHRALAPGIELEAGDVDLATLPIFTLANLASGVTTVIPDVDLRRPGAVDAARVCAQIEQWNVSRITASPAFFERLVDHCRANGRTLSTLRKLHTGGAPVFPRLLDALAAVAPQARVVAVYGSTEAEPIAHIGAHEISDEERLTMQTGGGLLAGRPVAEIKLRVLHDRWGTPRGELTPAELESETLPCGMEGEIAVTGDHVLRGYLEGVGDKETKFPVGGEVWHRTGDAGMMDSRGRLWLLGRCAARIDDAHGRLYPFTVECVAMTFPEVRRAAVVAHAGVRFLVVEAAARDALEPKLKAATAWAHIDRVRFVSRMPVDPRHNAKIDYPALRRLLGIH